MMGLPDVAAAFQRAGITALVYDPRSTGQSDGEPRNDIDPGRQVEDYSDALTFLKEQPTVDPKQMAVWGMSLSGAVALSAASLDRRARAVISACPIVEPQYDAERLPNVLAKCIQDRESQAKGNPPFYIPMLTPEGDNPAGFGTGIHKEHYVSIMLRGHEISPGGSHVNRTTIQSYYRMLLWQCSPLWQQLRDTPVLFLVPELDQTCPPEVQMRHFDRLPEPKQIALRPGRAHMDVFEGPDFDEVMKLQIDFLRAALGSDPVSE
jgi:pimeloyl-ACP methyl ester carboxylesterase